MRMSSRRSRRLGLGGDQRLDQGVAVDVVAHLIVSRARRPGIEQGRQLRTARKAGLVAERGRGRGAARVAGLQSSGEVRTLEPGGDEAGTERVAGTDRVHDHREWHGRGGDGSLGIVACDREAAAGAELRDDDGGAEREGGASEVRGAIGGAGIVGARAHLGRAFLEHGQLVRASQHHVGERGKAAQDRSRLGVRPKPAAQIEVEADGGPVRAGQPHRGLGRLARLGRERGGDPGHVEPSSPCRRSPRRPRARRPRGPRASRPTRAARTRPGRDPGSAARET